VPRSTLKNFAPQLRNVTLGPSVEVDICFVISLSKIRDRVYTLPYWPIQTRNSHTFN